MEDEIFIDFCWRSMEMESEILLKVEIDMIILCIFVEGCTLDEKFVGFDLGIVKNNFLWVFIGQLMDDETICWLSLEGTLGINLLLVFLLNYIEVKNFGGFLVGLVRAKIFLILPLELHIG